MEWSGQKDFVASPEVPFTVDDSEAGLLKNYGPLSFLKVSSFSLRRQHAYAVNLTMALVYNKNTYDAIQNQSFIAA
jgi:hypothetical protein